MFIRDRARQVGSLLLGAAALLVAINACGGSTTSVPAATATPTVVPTRGVSSTATTVPSATPPPTATRAPATATVQAAPTATPTRAATATPASAASTATPTPQTASTSTPAIGVSSQVIEVDITSDPYLFVPDTLTFQAGRTYTLRIKAPKEAHTFTVSGLALNIFIFPGQASEQLVSFTDVGTYKLVCTIHEPLGQTGKVIVTQGS